MRWSAVRLTAATLALGAMLVAAPQVAEASYLAELTIEERTDAAAYIVEGDVVEVWTETDQKQRIWTRAKVQVSQQHKGHDLGPEIVVDSMGGTLDGVTLTVVGRAVFSEGERVFLFLDEIGSGRIVPLGKFLGKYTIRRASGDVRHHAMTWQARRPAEFDHRFLPHPEVERRLYVDDLRGVVAARLGVGWKGDAIPGVSPADLEARNTPERRRVER